MRKLLQPLVSFNHALTAGRAYCSAVQPVFGSTAHGDLEYAHGRHQV